MFSRTKVTVDAFRKEEPARNLDVELTCIQAKIKVWEPLIFGILYNGKKYNGQNPWITLAELKADEAELLELIKQKEEGT